MRSYYAISIVNPERARHFALALAIRAKADPIDAQTLAELAARLQPEPWTPPPAIYTELQQRLVGYLLLLRPLAFIEFGFRKPNLLIVMLTSDTSAPTPDASAATTTSPAALLRSVHRVPPTPRTDGGFQHNLAGSELAVGFEARQAAAGIFPEKVVTPAPAANMVWLHKNRYCTFASGAI
ncbi:MAG: hypothetical protein ACJ8CR_08290 [Roseiflexaceae bacterium]